MNRPALGLVALLTAGCAAPYQRPELEPSGTLHLFRVDNRAFDIAKSVIGNNDPHYGGLFSVRDVRKAMKIYDALRWKIGEKPANDFALMSAGRNDNFLFPKDFDFMKMTEHAEFHKVYRDLSAEKKAIFARGHQKIRKLMNIVQDKYIYDDPEEFYAHLAFPEAGSEHEYNSYRAALMQFDMEALTTHLDTRDEALRCLGVKRR